MTVSTILNKTTIPYIVIAGLVIYILMIKPEVKTVVVPSYSGSKEVVKPVPVVRYDTIEVEGKERIKIVEVENPYNEELLRRYNEALDSIEKLNMFKEAITQRTYTEHLEDSIIKITVNSNTTGTLDYQKVSYKTKERTIQVNTGKIKPKLYLSGFGRSEISAEGNAAFGVKADLVNENTIITAGYDSRTNLTVGIGFKLF